MTPLFLNWMLGKCPEKPLQRNFHNIAFSALHHIQMSWCIIAHHHPPLRGIKRTGVVHNPDISLVWKCWKFWELLLLAETEKPRTGKATELFVFQDFGRVPVDSVKAGDICAITGLPDVSIGETLCNTDDIIPLPSISVSSNFIIAILNYILASRASASSPVSKSRGIIWSTCYAVQKQSNQHSGQTWL